MSLPRACRCQLVALAGRRIRGKYGGYRKDEERCREAYSKRAKDMYRAASHPEFRSGQSELGVIRKGVARK